MADFTRAMLYHILVPGRQLFAITIPVVVKVPVQTITAKSSALSSAISSWISHYALTSTYLSLPCQTWNLLPPKFRIHCQPDDPSNLAFALLFTATLLLALLYLHITLIRSPHHRIATTIFHLHSLERAITRQTEINHHLSRPSQNSGLHAPTCTTMDFEQWALHWVDIQRLRQQAEKEFSRGAPVWCYDEKPDWTGRKHELEADLRRLQGVGREIVNARQGARRFCGKNKGAKRVMVDRGEGWLRWQVETGDTSEQNEQGTLHARRRIGFDVRKASGGKAVFQQEIDTIGRLTPGGRFG